MFWFYLPETKLITAAIIQSFKPIVNSKTSFETCSYLYSHRLTALAQAFQVWRLSNDETFEIQLGAWWKYRYFPDEGFVKFFGVLRCIINHIVLSSPMLFVNYGKISVFTFARRFHAVGRGKFRCNVDVLIPFDTMTCFCSIFSRIEITHSSLVVSLLKLLKTNWCEAFVYSMLMRIWVNNGICV